MSEIAAVRTPGRGRRRAVTAIALGLLAMGALTACRTDAGTAAYVGNTRITQDYINSTVDSVDATKLAASGFTPVVARGFIAEYAAFNEVASRYAASKGYATPKPDPTEVANIANALGVPAGKIDSNPFIEVIAQGDAWQKFLLSKTPDVTATDADYRVIYDELVQAGELAPTTSFDSVKAQLQQALPTAGKVNALRKDLQATADAAGISVNPRYAGTCAKAPCGGLSFPLAQLPTQSSSISVMLVNMGGDASPAVIDSPAPPAPAAAAQ